VRKSAKKSVARPAAKRPVRKTAAGKAAARKSPPKRPPARKAAVRKVPAKAKAPAPKAPPRPAAAPARGAPATPAPAEARPAPVLVPRPPVIARPAAPQAPAAPAPVAARPLPETPRPAPKRPERPASELPHYAGMTENDLLGMPAGEYMNARQLAYFRELLTTMKQQLLENADLTSEHLRENDVVPDPADRATIEEEHALELRTRDRERKLMKKIDESLVRIEDGSYGWCEETGEPIGLPRLLARPTATLSVEAQARRELKQKLYGE